MLICIIILYTTNNDVIASSRYRKCDANAKERNDNDPVGGIASGIGQTLMASAASKLAAGALSGASFFGGSGGGGGGGGAPDSAA